MAWHQRREQARCAAKRPHIPARLFTDDIAIVDLLQNDDDKVQGRAAHSSRSKKRKADVLEPATEEACVDTSAVISSGDTEPAPQSGDVHRTDITGAPTTLTGKADERPVKRSRTTLRTGLQMAACAVAGSMATFGFLLSPMAQRLAEL